MARPPLDVVVSLLTEVHVRHCATMMAGEGEVWRDPGGGFIRSANRLLPDLKCDYVLFGKKSPRPAAPLSVNSIHTDCNGPRKGYDAGSGRDAPGPASEGRQAAGHWASRPYSRAGRHRCPRMA
jgi:hypothetical protein